LKRKIKHRNSIIISCANLVLPIALVLGAYVIIHGHISPGGGFQGGVVIASAVTIVYVAYGGKVIGQTFNEKVFKISENIGALGFVLLASLGLIYGANFFMNIDALKGKLGALYSSGTIFWMNFAVGYKVLAGIGFLILVMVSTLSSEEEEE
jgi:multisubunit Na+/H+ antiporter MnhB subunit